MGNTLPTSYINGEAPKDVEGCHQFQSEEDDVFYDTLEDDDLVHVTFGEQPRFYDSLSGNHMMGPPRENNQVTALPRKDNQVTAPPHEGSHLMAPSRAGNYMTALLREDHVTALPREDDQVKVLPHEGNYMTTPPLEDNQMMASSREGNYMTSLPCEGNQVMSLPLEGDYVDNPSNGDELQVTWRDYSFITESMNASMTVEWEEDMQDPFEKAMASRECQKTQRKTQRRTAEDEETHTLLEAMKKLQAGDNQKRDTQLHNLNEDEEQDSRTQQHYVNEQQGKTQHYLDEQQERRALLDYLYGDEEHDSRTKQHCDVEQQDSTPQHHYEDEAQDRRTRQHYEDEDVEQDKTHQHCPNDEEHSNRPKYHYKGEQQGRTQQQYDDEQDNRSQYHLDYEKQDTRTQRHDNDNEQDSRPQHHCDDEKQDIRTQQQCDDGDDDDEQDSRPQHQYDDEKLARILQQQYDDEQDSRPQHHYDDEKQDTRTQQQCDDDDDDDDDQDSRPQHHYDDEKQDIRTQQQCDDDDDEQDSRPQQQYDDEKLARILQQQYDNEQDSRPQHHDDEKQCTRTHQHNDDKQDSRPQCHDDDDDKQDRTLQHYSDRDEEQDGRTHQHYHKEKDSRTPQHNEQDSRIPQQYDSEAQGRRTQQHYTGEGEASRSQYHGSEGEASKAQCAGWEKHTWSRGRGRGCVHGGQHWMGWHEGHPHPHHTHSWRHHEQSDMQDGHELSWRFKHPRRVYGNHPYRSGNCWRQRQQHHNSYSNYYRDTELDSSALNGVHTGYDEDEGSALECEQLVGVLAELHNFRSTYVNLFDYRLFAPESVRKVAAAHPHIFHTNKNGVQLQPQIRLCLAHVSAQGCINYRSCRDLHVCSTYISRWCSEKPCPHGHSLYTEHNKAVLSMFGLAHLSVMHLKKLLRHLIPAVTPPSGCIDVCRDYNGGQCKKTDCQSLHLCLRFVVGRAKCDRPKCGLNHNPLNQTCCMLLTAHGISVNETIMDIIVALLNANPTLVTADGTQPLPPFQSLPDTKATPEDTNPRKPSTFFSLVKQKFRLNSDPSKSKDSSKLYSQESRGSPVQGSMDKNCSYSRSERSRGSGQDSSDMAALSPESDGKHSTGSKSPSGGTQGGRQTVWAYHRRGNVGIAEICRFSVEGICLKEDKGCWRLHASRPFHWQMCESEEQDSWLNLPGTIVSCLELAFCDPAKNGVRLPPLTPAQLRHLEKVLDQDTWYANFEAMVLSNSDYSKMVALRRLCVQSSAAPQHAKACTFSWFFCDVRGRWVKYGQADTTGQASQKSSVTSADIEAHYLAHPNVPLSFKVSQFTYVINFGAMTQTNQTTKVQRAVRRRPEPHPSLHSAGTQGHQADEQPAV